MAIGRIQKNMAFFGRIENFGQESTKSGHFHSFFFKNTPLQFSFQIWLTFQKSQKCNKNSKFLHVWVLTPLNFLLEKIGRKWPYSDFPIGRIQLKVPGNPVLPSSRKRVMRMPFRERYEMMGFDIRDMMKVATLMPKARTV